MEVTDSIASSSSGQSLWSRVAGFYRISAPAPEVNNDRERFRRVRIATFLSATIGYALYYVCRLSMNIVRKPIVDDGVFTETQLGIIGSCQFFCICCR